MELKIGEFVPEFAGKMNFYLSVVDEKVKAIDDKPSIGIILCKSKNKTTVEYALRDMNKPIGIAAYQFTQAIPENLKGDLPTIEELEKEADKEIVVIKKPLDQKLDKLKDLLNKLNKPTMEKVQSQAVVKELYLTVITQLVDKIKQHLIDIIPLFANAYIAPSIDGHTNQFITQIDVDAHFSKDINTRSIGVTVYLDGFKKAGTEAFSLHEYFYLDLDRFSYTFGQNKQEKWGQKTYDDIWNATELEEVSEKFAEIVINKITEKLEGLD